MNANNEDLNEKNLKNNIDDEESEKVAEEENSPEDGILNAKEEEISDLKNKLVRLQADFVNYKKRTEKDKENSVIYGIESIIKDLLPIIDNFQRSIDSEVDKENNFYKGVSLIEQQLIELLRNNSVDEIDCLGKPFDPNFHHAVFMEESDEYESGIIIEVLQKGYLLKDKVIRPSMVKVSK
ncbi:nucleotide exchange factor GrpE [Tissierella sp. Yu-01]|uniref:nucleotide exchange factor GrpE n=1 Tax=Tissierella sp. Yu-01 TaxID=3035694 RepID=UPI00240D7370|nr:nucleotide exchange factor GrpE [Tissierella sp. Yu-01]WFA09537.1 nucleotide exchange factor GrpE [Tissierella sp. Yu-01]